MSENNKERNLDSYLNELRNVMNTVDDLSYDDIAEEMNVAYKVVTMISALESKTPEEEDSKSAKMKEVTGIMTALGDASRKKKNEEKAKREDNAVSEKKKEPIPSIGEVTPGRVYNEENTKKERKIPSPVFDEPEVAEAKVEKAVSSVEPSEKEIQSAINEQKEPKVVVNAVQINNGSNVHETTKEEFVDISQKEEKHVEAYTKITPKPTEEPKSEMVIDSPEENTPQIIVPKEDKDSKEDETGLGAYEFLENKPFDGDDDEDDSIVKSEKEEDLSNIELEEMPSKEELRKMEIEKEFSSLPKDMHPLSVKTVSRKKISETLKALQNIKTDGLNIDKINMFDFDANDEVIRREYLKTRNDMISNPKISRIGLLMSGHYEEISAYGNWDLVSVERTISNPDESFVDRELTMLNSIYEHVKYVSYSTEKPSFEGWAKNIMYPDVASLFFGVYDANSIGENNYSFNCPYCGSPVSISKRNRDLVVAVPKELTQDKLERFITNKDIMKVDSSEYSKKCKNAVVRIQLPNSKIIVDFSIPTLYDYIIVLNTAQRISRRDLSDALDLSAIDIFNSDGKEEDTARILAYLYVKSIGIPAKVEGSNKFRYIKLENKGDIIEHINGLDIDDYDYLLSKDEVQDLIVRTSTKYYIEDAKCTSQECGKTIKYVALDPKQIFFFKIGEGKNRRMM